MNKLGRYEIARQIGAGGFGRIYLARDPAVNREVALKVLSTANDEALLQRFRTEAAAAGNLRHPNIVTIYEYDQIEGTAYIAMEYVDGPDVQRALAAGRIFSPLAAVELMRQVALALRHAHQHSVLHRDIKPANILISPSGEAKVTDFGIARVLKEGAARLTAVGFLIGTPFYMAPEQFANQPYSTASEIWAFGLLFYEILAGAHPFAGTDQFAVVGRIQNEDIPPLRQKRPDVPEELAALIHSMISRDLRARPQSFDDILLDLDSLLPPLRQVEVKQLEIRVRALIEDQAFLEAAPLVRRILECDATHKEARRWREELRKLTRDPEVQRALEGADKAVADDEITFAAKQLEQALVLHPTSREIQVRLAELQQIRARRANQTPTPPSLPTPSKPASELPMAAELLEAKRMLDQGELEAGRTLLHALTLIKAPDANAQRVADEARAELAKLPPPPPASGELPFATELLGAVAAKPPAPPPTPTPRPPSGDLPFAPPPQPPAPPSGELPFATELLGAVAAKPPAPPPPPTPTPRPPSGELPFATELLGAPPAKPPVPTPPPTSTPRPPSGELPFATELLGAPPAKPPVPTPAPPTPPAPAPRPVAAPLPPPSPVTREYPPPPSPSPGGGANLKLIGLSAAAVVVLLGAIWFLLSGRGGNGGVAEKPAIILLQVSPVAAQPGESVSVNWQHTGQISAAFLTTPAGKTPVTGHTLHNFNAPAAAGEYSVKLELSGPGGTVTESGRFTVTAAGTIPTPPTPAPPPANGKPAPTTPPPPAGFKILSFDANPTADAAELRWTLSADPASLALEGGGQRQALANNQRAFTWRFTSNAPAAVTLIAQHANGTERRTLTIQPRKSTTSAGAFRLTSFRPSTAQASIEGTVTLTWSYEGEPDDLRLRLANVPAGSRASLDVSVKGRRSYSLELSPMTYTRFGPHVFVLTATSQGRETALQAEIQVKE